MKKYLITFAATLFLAGCWKPMNLETDPIPGNTLVLEFAAPVKFVMDLKIDGQDIPIRYASKNRKLWIEGLSPGDHTYNVTSISYVYGPEVGNFKVTEDKGTYFFLQSRKYRSSTPKNKARVSIRAYRKQLKKDGINASEGVAAEGKSNKIRAYFTR